MAGGNTALNVAILLGFTLLGLFLGSQRDVQRSASELAANAHRERELAVLGERNRIAREMHDVLAHRMSLVSLNANVLAYRPEVDATETTRIAHVIEENARASVAELRSVLSALRSREEGTAPQPTLAALPALVEEARAGGQRIEVAESLGGDGVAAVPALVGRHAYRIIQEALTNARKHAPDAPRAAPARGRPQRGAAHHGDQPGDATEGVRARCGAGTARAGGAVFDAGRLLPCGGGRRRLHRGGAPAVGDAVTEPIRALLVDDDPFVRSALSMLLGADPGLEVVGEAADGDEALVVAGRVAPDVVLMDLRMPHRDGLSATTALLARPQAPKVIVLTTLDSDDMVLQALAAGADGFLLKESAPPRMVEAIEAVVRGEPILSPAVTRALIVAATRSVHDDRRAAALASLEPLSDREREVAVAIGRGLTNAEIADELDMSVATVKGYVTRVLTKVGAANRVQVAIRVHDAGLV